MKPQPPETVAAAGTVTTPDHFKQLTARLEQTLKLRALPFGMKLCTTVDEMQAGAAHPPPAGRAHAGPAGRPDRTVGLDRGRDRGGPGGRPMPVPWWAWAGKTPSLALGPGRWWACGTPRPDDSARHQAAMHCRAQGHSTRRW